MQPPICEICSARFDPSGEGGLVKFADYEPLPDGVAGHPDGLLWFCERHHEAARGLSTLRSGEALERLKRDSGSTG